MGPTLNTTKFLSPHGRSVNVSLLLPFLPPETRCKILRFVVFLPEDAGAYAAGVSISRKQLRMLSTKPLLCTPCLDMRATMCKAR